MASREVTLETLDHSGAGNTCPSDPTTQTNDDDDQELCEAEASKHPDDT